MAFWMKPYSNNLLFAEPDPPSLLQAGFAITEPQGDTATDSTRVWIIMTELVEPPSVLATRFMPPGDGEICRIDHDLPILPARKGRNAVNLQRTG